jgi:hypothetical protein
MGSLAYKTGHKWQNHVSAELAFATGIQIQPLRD